MSPRAAWPLLVGVLAALAVLAVAADVPAALRATLVAAFLLAAPGLALLPLTLRRAADVALLAVPAGMAVSVVVGTAAMYAVGLSELTALRCILVVCGAGAALQLVRPPAGRLSRWSRSGR